METASPSQSESDDVLRSVYSTVKRYNKDIEGLIVLKLQNEIEDHVQNEERMALSKMMPRSQFERFCKKIPRRYRQQFMELKVDSDSNTDSNEIPYAKIEALFHELKENRMSRHRRNDNAHHQPPSISKLYGGYLQYGDDDGDLNSNNNAFID